jgi:polar amino acid transport system substrate-binding protein
MRRTTRRASALMLALALTAAACGGDDTEDTGTDTTDEATTDDDEAATDDDGDAAAAGDFDLVSEGALTVCSDIPYEPFEFADDSAPSGYSGFDIDLMQEIADGLGLELEVVESGFDGLASGATLAAGTCDIVASAMTITEERSENLTFSEPYYDSLQSLITSTDSDVTSLEDLSGQNLGVQTGTTGQAFAEENAPDDTEIVSFETGPELFTAITAGQIQAGLQDLPVNIEQVQNNDGFEIVEEFETDEQYGFAVALDNEALIDAVNEQLQQLRDDSTYDEIYDRYFAAE